MRLQLGGRMLSWDAQGPRLKPSMTYKGEVCKMNLLMNLK